MKNTEANSCNSSGADDTQEEAHLSIPTSNHFKQEEFNQDPPHSTQEATVEDEPIARRTQGRLQHEQFVANEATNDGELGESASDQDHTNHLSVVQDRMRHPVAFLAEMWGEIM